MYTYMYIYIHTCVLTRVRTHMHVTLALGSKGYNYSMFSHGEFRIQDGTICQILYGDSSYAGWTLNKMGSGRRRSSKPASEKKKTYVQSKNESFRCPQNAPRADIYKPASVKNVCAI